MLEKTTLYKTIDTNNKIRYQCGGQSTEYIQNISNIVNTDTLQQLPTVKKAKASIGSSHML